MPKIKTCPDITRKHSRIARTYREATGSHAVFDERRSYWHNLFESRAEMYFWGALAVLFGIWVVFK